MIWEAVSEACTFAFLPALEPLFGARALVGGEMDHHVCTDIFGAEQVADWKRRYRFLFGTYDAVKRLSPSGVQDFLLDTLSPELTAEHFQSCVLSRPAMERLWRQCGWEYFGISADELEAALTDDGMLTQIYERVETVCADFLAFSAFVRQNERYLRDFFALAQEMNTPALRAALEAHTEQIEALREKTRDGLRRMEPLAFAQELMGKTFYHRGPYETFFILPSLLMPFAYVRLFYDEGTPHNRMLLFCTVRSAERGQARILAELKALADPTRYQILMLLARNGPCKGQDVARALHLAPSTVSHHMTELRDNGLVTEEQVRSAKLFGVSRNTVKELLSTISSDLRLEE
ncbi:MAG: helix-turn-helix transcriptional regulator [Oscillospiraceae bacterium]|nr:helix-turn-helix transcriptional regulator [Oscillospiraceae bacterium]